MDRCKIFEGTITMTLSITFTLVDSTTLTVINWMNCWIVEFLVKLENWQLITIIEINFFKALKALTVLL